MNIRSVLSAVAVAVSLFAPCAPARSAPAPADAGAGITAEDLARRLEWFQDQRFGFMMHWGVYSQWGCIESWPLVEADPWARPDGLKAWIERGRDMERFKRDYFALNRTFDPSKFDPSKWARAARQAGMKYVVFTTKHHDGFCMFDTRQTDYRVTHPDCPYSRRPQPDIVRDVFDAFRREGFGIGAYFSKSDWHSPYYWSPGAPATNRNPNYDTLAQPERWAKFRGFVYGQIEELVSNYGPIDILWLDGGQVRPPRQDVAMDCIAAMARRHQPGLIMVDRTVRGPYENYRTPEQQVPDQPMDYVWESCITMGKQWSYKPDDEYKSARQLVHLLVDVVAKGGNLLLNVGPSPDGELPPEALARMMEIGDWMAVHGEAIYGTRPIAPYKAGQVCLTRKGPTVYAILLMPEGQDTPPASIALPALPLDPDAPVRMLGSPLPLTCRKTDAGWTVELPAAVVKNPPGKYAVALKLAMRSLPTQGDK